MRKATPGADFEVIVLGGGINGLVCATLLAQAKRRVVLLEARDKLGGFCQTGEIAPGYRVSTVSHLVGPLDVEVVKSLKLAKFGLQFSTRQVGAVALSADGNHIVLGDDLRHTAQSLGVHSQADARAWAPFETRLKRVAQQIQPWMHAGLPGGQDHASRSGLFGGRNPSRPVAPLDAEMASRLDNSLSRFLDDEFASDALKGAVAFDALLGNALSPSMGGTAFLAVLKRAMDVQNSGGASHPQGGAGSLTAVLAKAADAAGVRVRLNAKASHFLFDNGRIAGVEMSNGEAVYASHVVSSLDARHTLLNMGAERDLPLGLKRRLYGFRNQGCVARVNLALSALPNFKGLDRKFLKDRLLICPSLEYLEASFAACEQGAFSSELALDLTVPTFHDATLARPGHHVVSINVMYVPRTLASGPWDAAKGDLLTMVASKLRQYAPELPDQVEAAQLFTPEDLEVMGGGAGNHWHGGDLSMDQLGIFRPVAGASRNVTPVQGLYLCGAGTHPCGGVTGTNGRIAAETLLAHLGQMS